MLTGLNHHSRVNHWCLIVLNELKNLESGLWRPSDCGGVCGHLQTVVWGSGVLWLSSEGDCIWFVETLVCDQVLVSEHLDQTVVYTYV